MFGNEPLPESPRLTDYSLTALRIVTALLFLQHGMTKILSFPVTSASDPPMWSLLWVAGMLELFGSLCLLAGLLTRPVAFLLSGEMAVAYWTFHAPKSTYPMLNDGEAAILFCFIFLLFAAVGGGPYSADRWLRDKLSDEPQPRFVEAERG